MNKFINSFQDARKYFEVMAAYNIDRYRFQSMVSTAHKLISLSRYARQGVVVEELAKGVASVSDYWFYKTLHSPLFKEHVDAFEFVKEWADEHALAFNTAADSFNTDNFCTHLLVKNPHSGGYELFCLEDGKSLATDTYAVREANVATLTTIRGAQTPVYNFTRRECGAKSHALIGHQATH